MSTEQREAMAEALKADTDQVAVIVEYSEDQLRALGVLGVSKSDRESYAVDVVGKAIKNAIQSKVNSAVVQLHRANQKGNKGDAVKLQGAIDNLEALLKTL